MNGIWIIDAEGDGLTPTKLHVLSVSNQDGSIKKSTNDYDEMRKFFSRAKVIIGHNIARFDVPVFERILGIKITCKVVDSLALSWTLFPTRLKHGLEIWGEEFGVPKPQIDDWYNLSYEEYRHRCEEDVEINRLLWNKQFKLLIDLYTNQEDVWRYLDYISFKMYCAKLQEQSGWHVDVKRATKSLANLYSERYKKVEQLKAVMPPVEIYRTKERPKVFIKKDGSYSARGLEWLRLLAERGLPADHVEPIKILVGVEEPNPGSVEQIKDWLFSLGWKPETFKIVKNKKTGATRKVPQVSLEQTKELCPSVIRLIEKEPALEVLQGLTTISSRIATLNMILQSEQDGKTKAQVAGLTNTLRFKHQTLVNLPKVNKPFAEDIRESLVAPEGFILCGSDMSSLEDRIKQHFIYPFDPGYVDSMNQPDFDPHLVIAELAGLMTKEDVADYKAGNKIKKHIRNLAKTANYACQYGAGIPRLMDSAGISREAATQLFNAYWKLNWAVKKAASVQVVKTVEDQMWLRNPINGFWYSLRFEKDIFSTLVQGTASYVFDMWLKNILDVRPQLTGQFHDEIILCIRVGAEEKCRELITNAINKLNEDVKLNRKLDVDIQFDRSYGRIH